MSIMEQKWSGFIGPLCAQWFSDPAVPPKEYVVMPLLKIFLPVRAAGRRDLVERLLQLVIGLTLYGVALGLMIRGGIGVAPWDVLALGISGSTGIRYGLVTNIVAVGVLLLWIPLRQRLGIGTLLNALMLGPVADATLAVIPPVPSLWVGSALFVTGLVLLAFATGLYISADFGPGPRDGLMTGLVRATGWPVWVVRTLIEGSVLLIGFLLGGPVGVGTVIFAFGVGPLIGWFLPWISRMRQARSRILAT